MIYDSRKLEKNFLIEGDVCIVGAGAAGISMALDMMSMNFKTILLEGGGFEYEDKMQQLYKGNIKGPDNYPLTASRLHYFGGTTNHWGGHCSPLDEIDFKKRNWVENSGWPISKSDLEPYFSKTSEILELESSDFSLEYWGKIPSFSKKIPINNEAVIEKIWQYSSPVKFNTKYRNTIENSDKIHLYSYANVTNILSNEGVSNIEELEVNNHEGRRGKVKAKYFILACGAVQNARLLLNSRNNLSNGLGNHYDLVGRYFMEHIHMRSNEIWLNRFSSSGRYILDWGKTKANSRFSISPSKQEEFKILNGVFRIETLIRNRTEKTLFERFSNEDATKNGYSLTFGEKIQRKLNKYEQQTVHNIDMAFGTQVMMEQPPKRNARVILENERDELGMLRAGLEWNISSHEKYSILKMFELTAKELGLSGIGRVKLNDSLLEGNEDLWVESRFPANHHMGTTRMSNDPKKGVVDSNCKVHGLNNLFVAGSSCFVTSGCANPTYTLISLSLRLSNHIKNKLNSNVI